VFIAICSDKITWHDVTATEYLYYLLIQHSLLHTVAYMLVLLYVLALCHETDWSNYEGDLQLNMRVKCL